MQFKAGQVVTISDTKTHGTLQSLKHLCPPKGTKVLILKVTLPKDTWINAMILKIRILSSGIETFIVDSNVKQLSISKMPKWL